MKRIFSILLCVLIAITIISALSVLAEETINFDELTTDELIEIRDAISAEITARQKAWALEHANRKIDFEEETIIVFSGKSAELNPIITRMTEDAPESTKLVWTSEDAAIAKVSSNKVTGVSMGVTTLNCVAADDENVIGSVQVQVVLPVSGITIESETMNLLLGSEPEKAETALKAVIAPEDAYITDVQWTSSDESVATVSEDGVVHALKAGSVSITATSLDTSSSSAKKATVKMTVQQAVTSITLTESDVLINNGKSVSVKAAVYPEDASSKKLEWTSSNPNVAVYSSSNGAIQAKGNGSCTITVSAVDGSGISASCNVKVITMVTGLKFEASKQTVREGGTISVRPKISPENPSNSKLTWTSSNRSVATVENGIVKGIKGGDCTITCTTTDGSNITASYSLHVASEYDKADKTTESKAKKYMNGYCWEFWISNGKGATIYYTLEFFSPNTFEITSKINGAKLSNSGTYEVLEGFIALSYKGKPNAVYIPYTFKNGDIDLDVIEAFDDWTN